MENQRETADKYQGLFNLMYQEYNLLLTIEEMDEIILESQKVVSRFDDVIRSKPKHKKTGESFFESWDKVIKNIKL